MLQAMIFSAHDNPPWSTTQRKAISTEMLVPRKSRLLVEIGAGEGIRTLDPDLGKVVLYP